MSRPAAILRLIRARARRRPGPVLFTVIGLTVATGFAGAVAAQSTIAGDRAARDVLRRLSPLERAVRITTSDVVGPSIESRARALLHTLGLRTQAEVALLNPVRLSGWSSARRRSTRLAHGRQHAHRAGRAAQLTVPCCSRAGTWGQPP